MSWVTAHGPSWGSSSKLQRTSASVGTFRTTIKMSDCLFKSRESHEFRTAILMVRTRKTSSICTPPFSHHSKVLVYGSKVISDTWNKIFISLNLSNDHISRQVKFVAVQYKIQTFGCLKYYFNYLYWISISINCVKTSEAHRIRFFSRGHKNLLSNALKRISWHKSHILTMAFGHIFTKFWSNFNSKLSFSRFYN
jgi:hypothetical protein